MEILQVIGLMCLAFIPGLFLYKYIKGKQFLRYDDFINGRLLFFGVLFSVVSIVLRENNILDEAIPRVIFDNLLQFLLFYIFIIRRKNYLNRYDIFIYLISISFGYNSVIALFTILNSNSFPVIESFLSIITTYSFALCFGIFYLFALRIKKHKFLSFLVVLLGILLSGVLEYVYNINKIVLNEFSAKNTLYLIYVLVLLVFIFVATKVVSVNNKPYSDVDEEDFFFERKNRKSFKDILGYRFDSLMSKGTFAAIFLLFVFALIFITTITLIVNKYSPEITGNDFPKAFWMSFMRVIDSGNLSGDPDFNDGLFLTISIIATISGLCIVSSLIGIISGTFSKKVEALSNSNRKVLENNHILILGYTSSATSIINNLINIKKRRKRLKVVLLNDRDRDIIREEIFENVKHNSFVKIICRTGDITNSNSLRNVGVSSAKSIIFLNDDDETILKSALAVTNLIPDDELNDHNYFSVLNDTKNNTLLKGILKTNFIVLNKKQVNYAPLIKTMSNKDYLYTYRELTKFNRTNVLSTEKLKNVVGLEFKDLVTRYLRSCPIGVLTKENVIINPKEDYIIKANDEIIILKNPRDQVSGLRRYPLEESLSEYMPTSKNYFTEKVKSILIIGSKGKNNILDSIAGFDVKVDSLEGYTHEKISDLLKNNYDLIFVINREKGSLSDDELIRELIFINQEYNRKLHSTYLIADLANKKTIGYSYENELVDYILKEDKSRYIASEIMDNDSKISTIEKLLFNTDKGVDLVPALNFVNKSEILILTIFQILIKDNILCIGYGKYKNEELSIVLNPNKNDSVTFGPDDFFIIIN